MQQSSPIFGGNFIALNFFRVGGVDGGKMIKFYGVKRENLIYVDMPNTSLLSRK